MAKRYACITLSSVSVILYEWREMFSHCGVKRGISEHPATISQEFKKIKKPSKFIQNQ
jgi:hypothetical protein